MRRIFVSSHNEYSEQTPGSDCDIAVENPWILNIYVEDIKEGFKPKIAKVSQNDPLPRTHLAQKLNRYLILNYNKHDEVF